ncbi:hypothetical protein JCM3765_007275 [Sporobolomyces pararoseus]
MPISSIRRENVETLPAPTPVHRSNSTLRRRISRTSRRHSRRRRAPKLTWQSASFHFSLFTTLIVIGLLWSIAPLTITYLIYTILTFTIPKFHPFRPIQPETTGLGFKILHWLFVAYGGFELPFLLLYKWLSFKQQKLRKPLKHSRVYLRGLILKSLENGLTLEQEFEKEEEDQQEREEVVEEKDLSSGVGVGGGKPEQSWIEGESSTSTSTTQRRGINRLRGDGAATPEISTTTGEGEGTDYLSAKQQLPTLHLNPSISRSSTSSVVVEDEGFSGSRVSLDSAFVSSSPRKSRQQPTYPPSPSNSQSAPLPRSKFIQPPLKNRSDPRAIDFRNYLRFWFGGCRFEEIKKLNMADWLSWSLYGTTFEQIEKERKEWDLKGRPKYQDGVVTDEKDHPPHHSEEDEEDEIEGDKYGLVMHCVELVEARAAHRFEPGRNEKIQTLRLTLDPVRVTQRPLILYLVVGLLQNGVLAATKLKGFREFKDGKVKYLCRIPKDWNPDRNGDESTKPLVFIHGLGMGSAQYATFMSYLCSHRSFKNRPLLILLQPHISMSFFEKTYHDPPDQESLVKSLISMIKKFKFDQAGGATILSHSNGTIVHGWLVKSAPELCARNCFVDPVCFCLWEPFVCYNFLYSKPKTPIEYLMRYFVSRELGIAIMLSRTFEWTSNLLFPSQIPNLEDPLKSSVFLAQQDSILNAERVKIYLKRNGFVETFDRNIINNNGNGAGIFQGQRSGGGRLKVFEGLKHGQNMIGEGDAFEEIMEWICKAPKGTLAPGTASPRRESLPPSLTSSEIETGGEEEEGGEVVQNNRNDTTTTTTTTT